MEDQTILLDSLASAIDAEDDFTVVDKLSDAAAIHASVRIHPVDLVLMDVVTENSSGLSESAKLKQDHPNLKVVIFTAMPDAAFVQEAQEAGVDSFVYKKHFHPRFVGSAAFNHARQLQFPRHHRPAQFWRQRVEPARDAGAAPGVRRLCAQGNREKDVFERKHHQVLHHPAAGEKRLFFRGTPGIVGGFQRLHRGPRQ